ncbi:MAG: PQQ-binding-like beta-propeller repeat protein [Planctomycetota bacterium]
MRRRQRGLRPALLISWLLAAGYASAADWPQWMGPGRDNVWREGGLIDQFPPGGPPVVWRVPVAGGYAGPAVADGRVYVTDYVTSDEVSDSNFDREPSTGIERVHCFDQATGESLWSHEYPVTYMISYPAGPRCTPTVYDGRVYTLGAEGRLICFDAASGEVVWSKDFLTDYGAKTAIWGYAASPLVVDDTLVCVVGGEGSHAVAFDLITGEERWRTLTAADQGYSPPTLIETGSGRQLLLMRPDGLSSVNPTNGEELWTLPYRATSGSMIMSPVVSGEYVFVGCYQKQTMMVRLSDDAPRAEVVWRNKRKHGMSPANVQPMVEGDIIYGVDGSGELMAVQVPSGERLWTTSAPISERRTRTGTAFLVKQADRYWLFTENGELIIARLTPDGYDEIDRTKIIEPTNVAFGRDVVWCMPAFADGKIYVRNDKELISVDLAKP